VIRTEVKRCDHFWNDGQNKLMNMIWHAIEDDWEDGGSLYSTRSRYASYLWAEVAGFNGDYPLHAMMPVHVQRIVKGKLCNVELKFEEAGAPLDWMYMDARTNQRPSYDIYEFWEARYKEWRKHSRFLDVPLAAYTGSQEAYEKWRIFEFVTCNSDIHSKNVVSMPFGQVQVLDQDQAFFFLAMCKPQFSVAEFFAEHKDKPTLPGTLEFLADLKLEDLAESMYQAKLPKQLAAGALYRLSYLKDNPSLLDVKNFLPDNLADILDSKFSYDVPFERREAFEIPYSAYLQNRETRLRIEEALGEGGYELDKDLGVVAQDQMRAELESLNQNGLKTNRYSNGSCSGLKIQIDPVRREVVGYEPTCMLNSDTPMPTGQIDSISWIGDGKIDKRFIRLRLDDKVMIMDDRLQSIIFGKVDNDALPDFILDPNFREIKTFKVKL
jgi:hypothetical protein